MVGSCHWWFSAGGSGNYRLYATDSEQTPLSDLRFGEPYRSVIGSLASSGMISFNGISSAVFRAQQSGAGLWRWQYFSYGGHAWVNLNYGSPPPDDLRFGDFNGDGKTDVFATLQRNDGAYDWVISSAGLGQFSLLRSDPLPVDRLRFGDFNGDGKTDIFSVSERIDGLWQWRVSYAGATDWQLLAYAIAPLEDLRFNDFDGDGKTDVFTTLQRNDGTYDWLMSSGGSAPFVTLRTDPLGVAQLHIGDFNGDGKADVFSTVPRDDGFLQWRVSYAGTQDWQNLAYASTAAADLRFGLFDADPASDVFTSTCQQVPAHRPPATQAVAVLGQADFASTRANRGGGGSASTLSGPAATLVTPDGKLFVADYWNSRVLMWNKLQAFTNGEPAILALGQADTNSVGPNPQVDCGTVSAQTLCGPEALAYDARGAGTLYVADTHNHRVLAYGGPFGPASGQAAIKVFGQATMQDNDPNRIAYPNVPNDAHADTLFFPRGLAFDSNSNRLFVADDFNQRVLAYNVFDGNTIADIVLGHATLDDDRADAYAPNASNFYAPKGLAYDQLSDTLYVADYAYFRVLQFRGPFLANNQRAEHAFGQPDGSLTETQRSCQYQKTEPISDKVSGPIAADRLCNPLDVSVAADGTLYVSDATNSRVLVYTRPLDASAAALMPDAVFGQANSFTTGDKNKPDPPGVASANSFHRSMGMALSGNNLFVSDFDNNRVLYFGDQFYTIALPFARK